jgi:hypothetical protein
VIHKEKQVSTRIYGHSDDCIEIDGGNLREEFGLSNDSYLRFPDGLVIRCTFCHNEDECWRFRVVRNPANVRVTESGPDKDQDYELTIDATYTLVYHDDSPDGMTAERLAERLNDADWRDFPPEIMAKHRAALDDLRVALRIDVGVT